MNIAGRLVVLCWLGMVVANSPARGEPAGQVPATTEMTSRPVQTEGQDLVVVHFAESLFRALLPAAIEIETPVDNVVLGVHARGTATTKGALSIDLKPHPNHGTLVIDLRGTTTSTTVGNGGAAILYTTATTGFHATKNVVFDLQTGIHTEQATISARTATRLDGVRSTRCGMLGRVSCRIATRRFSQRLPLINQIALTNAKQRICDSFELELTRRLERVNETLTTFRPLFDPYFTPDPEYHLILNTTETHAVFRVVRGARPTTPSRVGRSLAASSLVELWLSSSMIHQNRPVGIRRWDAARDIFPIYEQNGILDRGAAETDRKLTVTFTEDGDWMVITAGNPAALPIRTAVRIEN